MMSVPLDRFRGCILGLAIGDALGSWVESASSAAKIREVAGENGVSGLPLGGRFTEETQLSMCVAEALIEGGRDMEKFMASMAKFVMVWAEAQKSPEHNRGPDLACLTACERLLAGASWKESGVFGAGGNSPATRSAPIGMLLSDNIPDIIDFAIESSRITSFDTEGECGAVSNALITSFALNDVPVGLWANELMMPLSGIEPNFEASLKEAAILVGRPIPTFLALSGDYIGEGWDPCSVIGGALFCCMREPHDFRAAVLSAVNSVGDSDALGSIVGGWMGAKLGLKGILPEWVAGIEDRDELMALADRLYAASLAKEGAAESEGAEEATRGGATLPGCAE